MKNLNVNGLSDLHKQHLRKPKKYNISEGERIKLQQRMIGNKFAAGRPPPVTSNTTYAGEFLSKTRSIFRSSYELSAMLQFNEQNIRWEYETLRISYGNGCTYIPDFWLPDQRKIIEIKCKRSHVIEKDYDAKISAAILWAEKNNATYEIWKEDKIKLLTTKDLKQLSNDGIIILTQKAQNKLNKNIRPGN